MRGRPASFEPAWGVGRAAVGVSLVFALIHVGCIQTSVSRPSGWNASTHTDEHGVGYEAAFPGDRVVDIEITMSTASWDEMTADLEKRFGELGAYGEGGSATLDNAAALDEPFYVPCDVRVGGVTWFNVGVRTKGQSALREPWQAGELRIPFRLDFDEFEDRFPSIKNQRFYGVKQVDLKNHHGDASHMREMLAGELYRDAGVPSPHQALYRVVLETGGGSLDLGLYTAVEVPGVAMLADQLGDGSGNLYEPQGDAATLQAGFLFNDEAFKRETNDETANWSDVRRFIEALHSASSGDGGPWRTELEKTFDVDGFLKWLAINTTIQDRDSYGAKAQNYYLYGEPARGGRLCWIPWDHAETFAIGSGKALDFNLATIGAEWPLISRLLSDQVYADVFWSYVAEFIASSAVAKFGDRVDLLQSIIGPEVIGDDAATDSDNPWSPKAAFESATQRLINHVQQRVLVAEQWLR